MKSTVLLCVFGTGCRGACQCGKMHSGDQPLATIFCDGQRNVEGKRELFFVFLTRHISGSHHPTHIRCQSTNPELVFKLLLSLVEALEEVLIGYFDFIWARPDFSGSGTHNCRCLSEAR